MRRSDGPNLCRDWVGMRVQTRRDMRNGYVVVSARTVLTVTRFHAGHFWLESDACKMCGVHVLIARVPIGDVDLIEQPPREKESAP